MLGGTNTDSSWETLIIFIEMKYNSKMYTRMCYEDLSSYIVSGYVEFNI